MKRMILKPTYDVLNKIPKQQKLRIEGKYGIYEGWIIVDKCNNSIRIYSNIERDDDNDARNVRISNIAWCSYIDDVDDIVYLLDELLENQLKQK